MTNNAAHSQVSPVRDLIHPSNSVGLLAVLLAWAGLSYLLPNFGTISNASNVLLQFGPLALLALGQTVVILVKGFDISVGAVLAISTVTGALAIEQFGIIGLIAVPATGIIFGLWNGVLIGVMGVPPIIATLGTLLLARGAALLITDSGKVVLITGDPQTQLLDFAFGQILHFPYSGIFTFAVFGCVAFFLKFTRAGRRLFLIGGGPEAARLVGTNVNRGFMLAYAICGLCAGLAGLLILAKTGAGLPTDGVGMELNAIAAAVIGGSLLSGGNAHPLRVMFAAMFIQIIYTGLSFSAVSPYAGEIIMGIVILTAGMIGTTAHRNQSVVA